jgi:hypothetical protein
MSRPAMLTSRRLFSAASCGLSACLAACGGGSALLHPAHPLPAHRVSAGAGVSATFAFEDHRAPAEPGVVPGAPADPGSEAAALESAALESALSPGLSPWVGARVGLGAGNEAGVTYTGRAARMDGRHAFLFADDELALSVGAGASAVLLRAKDAPDAGQAGERLAPRSGELSFGVDAPVVLGWRSAGSVVEAWVGARGGAEWLNAELSLAAPDGAAREAAHVDATRWFAGGLVGLALGFRPIALAVELDVAYQSVSAEGGYPREGAAVARRSATLSGVTVSPAGAIIGKF